MKQQNLARISKASGKSVSTVSKVLRGCGGVDSETREAVFCAAAGIALAPYEPRQTDVYAVLPDNPKFFWHRAYDALRQEPMPITLKIFSSIGKNENEYLLTQYIEEAILANARVLILSAKLSESMRERLATLAKQMLIIQLCEYTPIPNTFFVGADGERDGWVLGMTIPATEDAVTIGILTGAVSRAGEQRIAGFLAAVPSAARIFFLEKPTDIALYASHLARAVDALGVPLDYLFCFDGITTAACDALYKLRNKMNTRLLGFEYPPTAEKHMEAGRIAALAVQSPEEQMRTALALADRYLRRRVYPDRKYYYLPSQIIKNEKGERSNA